LYLESRWSFKKGAWIDRLGKSGQIPDDNPVADADHGIMWKVKRRGKSAKSITQEATILNQDLKSLLAKNL
jgi:hypothetical protein